ncbi:MAG: insulinase family protein [Deltaproteobacteria bacterium]|nr:insulinase family protein [Candidatus Anaeroferrophillacea bacterium]
MTARLSAAPAPHIAVGDRRHGFILERREEIPELRAVALLFNHEQTGARLLHLATDDPNNLFCIGFRTPVADDTGVPHILEHSVLSGSRKFPLKDPFKEMLKGSLQTFLNAMTYPDKTLYPVASQVEADFRNLMDVYCDAVFHPLLTPETFAQEGWHFDLPDADGPVDIRGIVYNEMKGVFSDFHSHVARRTVGALFPETTYRHESGGDPQAIPALTYEQFKNFHAAFYHPSNAFIFRYGNLPVTDTLAFLEQNYLGDFDRLEIDSAITPQPAWTKPREIAFSAPCSPEEDGSASVIELWLWDPATDPQAAILGRIFSHYLIGTQNSPLRRALIDSGLGEDLDDMSGFDADLVQAYFAAGLRHTRPEHAGEIQQLIRKTLQEDIDRGLDEELLEGAIRRVEFRLREISDSGHYPYPLVLAERCYRAWIYGGDPLAHLRFAAPLAAIKEHRQQGTAFFADRLRQLTLDNPHRLTAVITGSAAMGAELGNLTGRQVAELTKDFDADDRRRQHELTRKLHAYQAAPPDPAALASLPRLKVADLPRENRVVPVEETVFADVPGFIHRIFTAGIVYLDLAFDLGTVPPSLLPYVPLYTAMISRCGAGDYDFREMATRVSLHTGGIGCADLCVAEVADPDRLLTRLSFHGRALPERFSDLLAIFTDLFTAPRLSDSRLLRDLLREQRNDLQAGIVHGGHHYAVSLAAARLARSRAFEEQLDGISQLRFLENLVRADDPADIGTKLVAIHRHVINRRTCLASITAGEPTACREPLAAMLTALPEAPSATETFPFTPAPDTAAAAIEITSSVNFVARAWPIRDWEPAPLAHLHLLARSLSTGCLWDRIRVEGGAYGGMAMASSTHPVFACASYRDPHLERTLKVFQEGLEAAARGLSATEVEQSIIGTIGRIDAPKTPHNLGYGETVSRMIGRSPEHRQAIRDAVLSADSRDIARSARRLLAETGSTVAVIGSAAAIEAARHAGVNLHREPLLPARGERGTE